MLAVGTIKFSDVLTEEKGVAIIRAEKQVVYLYLTFEDGWDDLELFFPLEPSRLFHRSLGKALSIKTTSLQVVDMIRFTDLKTKREAYIKVRGGKRGVNLFLVLDRVADMELYLSTEKCRAIQGLLAKAIYIASVG